MNVACKSAVDILDDLIAFDKVHYFLSHSCLHPCTQHLPWLLPHHLLIFLFFFRPAGKRSSEDPQTGRQHPHAIAGGRGSVCGGRAARRSRPSLVLGRRGKQSLVVLLAIFFSHRALLTCVDLFTAVANDFREFYPSQIFKKSLTHQ